MVVDDEDLSHSLILGTFDWIMLSKVFDPSREALHARAYTGWPLRPSSGISSLNTIGGLRRSRVYRPNPSHYNSSETLTPSTISRS